MRYLVLPLLFAFSKICFGEELPVIKFPNKNEIEKAKIKELIKELDADSKEELLKENQQRKELKENPIEETKSPQSTASNPSSPKLYNAPTTNKPIYTTKPIYYKKSPFRSKAYCPT